MTEVQVLIILLIAILVCLVAVGCEIRRVVKDQTQTLEEFKRDNIYYTQLLRDTAEESRCELVTLRKQGTHLTHL